MKYFSQITAACVCFSLILSCLTVSATKTDTNIIMEDKVENVSIADYGNYIKEFGYSTALNNVNTKISSTNGDVSEYSDKNSVLLKVENYAVFTVDIPEDAAYNIKAIFANVKEATEEYHISLSIDDQIPFANCEDITFSSVWQDDGDIRELPNGDQIAPSQKHEDGYSEAILKDKNGLVLKPYEFMLSKGSHEIKVTCLENDFYLADIILTAPEIVESYDKVSSGYYQFEKYDGAQIVIEGEDSLWRDSASLSPKNDRASSNVSPSNPKNSVINYIGGEVWSAPGDTIAWEFNAPKDGLYKIGFSFNQSYVTNGETFRWLKIDGKTPFDEATKIGFNYGSSWQFKEFGEEEKEPYMVYLTEGPHEISMSVTLADTSDLLNRLGVVVEDLGNLYLDILMITGESPDANRDYELHKQIPNFVNILESSNKELKALKGSIGKELTVNGEIEGALNNMIRIIDEMTNNLYEAHTQVGSFSSAQQTLSAWLYDMRQMPLGIDQIIIGAPDSDFDTPKASFWQGLAFGFKRFIFAYIKDYRNDNVTSTEGRKTIKIWVNWGRDQVKILSNLIYSDFMANNDIDVVIEQVNATLVQGVISGNSPDLYLHLSRSQPVNLAMRDVLYDLKNFDDYEEVIAKNFCEGSETPYLYEGGCYALPDMQQFNVMFYREDILNKLGLKVPNTWDEFIQTTAVLQRNKMNVYLPYIKLASTATVDVGVGGLTFYPSLLMQMGGYIYNDKQNATALADTTAVKTFNFWTDFYTRYGLEPQADFYNKFRAGVYPLGITNYTTCFTISAGAPEIDGKWKIAEIPGIVDENGNINRTCAGSGSGCAIMNNSDEKEAAWEFLKWWVSEDVQYRYSRDVEAVLGETARVSSANVNAVKRLSWDPETLEVIMNQWNNVTEVPEVPGSYYVARSIDQAFWAVKNKTDSPREAMIKWAEVSDREIERKIKEYSK